MKREKTPLSINVIYWFTNFMLGLIAIGFVIFIIIGIVSFTSDSNNDVGFSLSTPLSIDILGTGTTIIDNQEVEVTLQKSSTAIRFVNPPRSILLSVLFIYLFVLLFVAFLILVFRKFIVNVRNGEVFTIQNISLIKWLSYGLVGAWIFKFVEKNFIYHYFVKNMEFDQIKFSDRIIIGFSFDYLGILIVAIFIWVLAHIFITGLKLQEEKDLTI